MGGVKTASVYSSFFTENRIVTPFHHRPACVGRWWIARAPATYETETMSVCSRSVLLSVRSESTKAIII